MREGGKVLSRRESIQISSSMMMLPTPERTHPNEDELRNDDSDNESVVLTASLSKQHLLLRASTSYVLPPLINKSPVRIEDGVMPT
jgi:hypothetical protein